MNTKLKLLLATIVVALVACANGPQRPPNVHGDNYGYTISQMRWMIGETMKKHDITGLSIALVDDQEIVWAEGFGYADKKNQVRATPDTIYRAGSITKLFTATAAMQLVEQGKMDIDQAIETYLPEFSIQTRFDNAGPITPRNIMTHHSGLPSDLHNKMWGDETATPADLLDELQHEYVATAPNTIESYSNVGFTVLGRAIEAVTGTSYERYIEEHILRPAGMSDSYIAANLRDESGSSKGYVKRKEHPTMHLRDLPAGALSTSVIDLARFAQVTFTGGQRNGVRILDPATLNQMQQFQDGDGVFDVEPQVGLAWRLDERFGAGAGLVASHNGGTPMFFSELLTLPGHKLAVVVLANSRSAAGIVEKIANEALALALESKTGIEAFEPAEMTATLPTLAVNLERLPGTWSTPMGPVRITRRGDKLKFEVGGTKLDLLRREDGYYHLQYKLLGLVSINMGEMGQAGIGYQKIGGREVLVLHLGVRPTIVVAEKLQPEPLPATWQARLGKYESINASGGVILKTVELEEIDGFLKVQYAAELKPTGDETLTELLLPVSDTQAIIRGLGRGKGDTVQFVDIDGETLMRYSGFLLRRVD